MAINELAHTVSCAMDDELMDAIEALDAVGTGPQAIEAEIWERFGCQRAVVTVDSTGFTRVTNARGIVHYLMLLAKVRAIVRTVFEQAGCLRYRAQADNIFGQFPNSDRALRAALAANEAIHRAGLMVTDSEPFTLCMGIGFGRLLDAGTEGVYGNEMNLAAKLGEDVAEGREILLTAAAFDTLAPESRAGFEERHVGFSGDAFRYYWTHWRPGTDDEE